MESFLESLYKKQTSDKRRGRGTSSKTNESRIEWKIINNGGEVTAQTLSYLRDATPTEGGGTRPRPPPSVTYCGQNHFEQWWSSLTCPTDVSFQVGPGERLWGEHGGVVRSHPLVAVAALLLAVPQERWVTGTFLLNPSVALTLIWFDKCQFARLDSVALDELLCEGENMWVFWENSIISINYVIIKSLCFLLTCWCDCRKFKVAGIMW